MNYRNEIEKIRTQYLKGKIDLDRAKEIAQPIIDEMNDKAKVIAKKYGRKHKDFTFSYLMR